MKLLSLKVQNFKGQKDLKCQFDGENYTVKGQNGAGKTTVFDAFLWLLFGKDSTGRTANGKSGFDIRPHDDSQQPIQGLVVSVEAIIEHDGESYTLLKENREKFEKGKITGFQSSYKVDKVTKAMGVFNKFIAEMIPEDKFKMLTDLMHFNAMHWSDRRKMLLEIAGDTGTPTGFNDLIELAGKLSVEDYKKVIAEDRKGYIKEQKESTPRIDELTKSLEGYEGIDSKSLTGKRDGFKTSLANLQDDRVTICNKETDRNDRMATLNRLRTDLSSRENALKNDTSGVQKYLDEKTRITESIGSVNIEISKCKNQLDILNGCVESGKTLLDSATKNRDAISKEYNATKNADCKSNCFTCGQSLPDDKIAEIEKSKKESIAEIAARGVAAKKKMVDIDALIQENINTLKPFKEELEKLNIKLQEAETAKLERFTKIDAIIANNETVDPEADVEWCKIKDEIAETERLIGDPVSEQIARIDERITASAQSIADINSKLSNFDNAQKTRKRIEELKERETELGQLIVDIDGRLAMINDYKTAQNNLISKSVNGLFKHVTFRMFQQNIGNDDTVDDCTAIYTGTSYSDCSTGEKIIIGIDIINTLSKHFKVSCPIFIDNRESLTKAIETESQVISLVADKTVDGLIVEKTSI